MLPHQDRKTAGLHRLAHTLFTGRTGELLLQERERVVEDPRTLATVPQTLILQRLRESFTEFLQAGVDMQDRQVTLLNLTKDFQKTLSGIQGQLEVDLVAAVGLQQAVVESGLCEPGTSVYLHSATEVRMGSSTTSTGNFKGLACHLNENGKVTVGVDRGRDVRLDHMQDDRQIALMRYLTPHLTARQALIVAAVEEGYSVTVTGGVEFHHDGGTARVLADEDTVRLTVEGVPPVLKAGMQLVRASRALDNVPEGASLATLAATIAATVADEPNHPVYQAIRFIRNHHLPFSD
jgi:hypothetical protein